MKILLCAGIFPPDIGGPATYTRILAEELTKRGHRVAVVCYSTKIEADTYGFPVTRILRTRFKLGHYFRYFNAIKKMGKAFDLLYAQDPVSSGYPTYLAARVLKKPFIVKVTGDYSWEQAMGRGYTAKLIDDFQKFPQTTFIIDKIREIQINVCRRAKLVITPSGYLKQLVAGWRVSEEKIRVVHNALPFPQASREKSAVRKELDFTADEFVAFSAGRDVPWKGFAALRQVGSELAKTIPKFRLEIRHKSSHELIMKYLEAADVFVLNTGYEGFPHMVWEAMSLGTPVVTTNVCGNPEIITSGENGLLVPFNDEPRLAQAIIDIYKNQASRTRMINNGLDTARKFSVESMVEKTQAIFEEIISPRV